MQQVIRNVGSKPHIAIIGAGFAGLRCADILTRSGAKVTIYEARDRIGGRVHQETLEGQLMDMGPNWIHGTENNPICSLASKTSTVLHDFDGRVTIIDSDGKQMSAEDSMHISETVWKIISRAFKYSEENKDNIDPSKSLYDFFKDQVPQLEPDPKLQSSILEMAHQWGSFVGDPVTLQSLKFFFLESTIDGATLFVASTYRAILHEVAHPARKNATIHLNEEVLSITSDISNPHLITLSTTKTPSVSYDEVIVTCPLGYLQHHKATLFPQPDLLSPRLSSAIDNMHYGDLEKIYVTFPSAWWAQPITPATTTTSSFSTPSSSPPTPATSTSTSTPPPTYPPSMVHFFTPTPAHLPSPAPSPQSLEAVSLSTPFPASCSQPTLLLYLYPPLSRILSDPTLSTSDLLAHLSPYLSHMPNYDPSSPACIPRGVLATSWSRDRLAGYGSYTNVGVGATAADENVRVVRGSQGTGAERGVWFAGEHTAPFVALGTTTGAYWAGEAVARDVAALWGLSVPREDGARGDEDEMIGTDPAPRRDAR